MVAPTKTETLDKLYTTTWALRKKEEVDQIFLSTPFWYLMSKAGRRQTREGGRWIEMPLNYAKNETVTWIGKGDTISIADTEHLTVCQWNWRYLAVSIVRYWTVEQQNRGRAAHIRMINSDLDNARDSMIDELESKLFTVQAGKAIDSLPTIVAQNPTTGTVANLNRATYDWWRNQYKDMTGEAASVYLRKRMHNMFNTCGKYGEGIRRFPTHIVCDQTVYEMYEDEAVEYGEIRIGDRVLADLGFGDLAYKGRPFTWSPSATDGSMWFLNHNNLYWIADTYADFDMTEWKPIPNQMDRVAQIATVGNVVCDNCRRQGVIFNIGE